MCGLYGFSGKHPVDLAKIRWLATLNEPRGRNSTGVFSFKGNKAKDTVLYKDNVAAEHFVCQEDAISAMRGANTIIGHTRLATQGVVSRENAHPFEFNLGTRVVGAHNGFIASELQKRYVKQYNLEEVFSKGEPDVDSMLLFAMLSITKGDYKELSNIEGGVVTLFSMPEKYGNILFAYKRAARDLHYGLSAEGIYLSSELSPLRMIGCNVISALQDDTLTLFKDGLIIDVVNMEKPKINIPLNTSRYGFDDHIPKGIESVYPELANVKPTTKKPTVYNQHGLPFTISNRQKSINMHSDAAYMALSKKAKVSEEDYEDRSIMIMKEVLEEVESLAPSNLKSINAPVSYDYSIDDLADSLILLQLIADGDKKEPLMAWDIYDKEKALDYHTLTGVNGVGVIRIKSPDTGQLRTLRIYDPIDGGSCFEFQIKAEAGRVKEVILSIPFQEAHESPKEGGETASTNNRSKRERNSRIFAIARNLETGVLDSDAKPKSLLANQERVSETLREQEEQVHRGHSGASSTGTEEQGNEDGVANEGGKGIFGKRNRAFSAKDIELVEALISVRKIHKDFSYDVEQGKYILTSKEYKQAHQAFKTYLGELIDLQTLFEDAVVLKYHDGRKNMSMKAIPYYAILLLDYFITPSNKKVVIYDKTASILKSDYRDIPYSYFKPQHIGKIQQLLLTTRAMLNAFQAHPEVFSTGELPAEVSGGVGKLEKIRVFNEEKQMMEIEYRAASAVRVYSKKEMQDLLDGQTIPQD